MTFNQDSVSPIVHGNESQNLLQPTQNMVELLVNEFKSLELGNNPRFPINDIGISGLFHHLYQLQFRYVAETSCYYIYNGKHWKKDIDNLKVKEQSKYFALALENYGKSINFEKLAKIGSSLTSLAKRESLIRDSSTIAPMEFAEFDKNIYLLNCLNGTYDLLTGQFRSHTPHDFITKISNVNYDPSEKCLRWEEFIGEIMLNDIDSMNFLQKAFGYTISGDTSQECFFILYGSSTRNGKSTCCETIAHLLGDYASHVQPETLAKNKASGSNATPDVARLQGIRLAITSEPEKSLEINASLVKQLTGGDKITSRFLNENPIEFVPEFKIVMNTNYQPRINDETIFFSERVRIIPFDRHFTEAEQDRSLKSIFRNPQNLSGILNWLIHGYHALQTEGFKQSERQKNALNMFREDNDVFGAFIRDKLIESDKNISTKEAYFHYDLWCRANGYKPLNSRNFVGECRQRKELSISRLKQGNFILNYVIAS